jgi:hypothetical protein
MSYVSRVNFLEVEELNALYDVLEHTALSSSNHKKKPPPLSESASELYPPSDRHLLAKWLPTFADRRFHVVSMTDPYGRILRFLDRSRYFSIK